VAKGLPQEKQLVRCTFGWRSGDLVPKSCKACASPQLQFIDAQMLAKTPYRVIVAKLSEVGENFSPANLSNHKPHVRAGVIEDDPWLEGVIEELRQEATMAPPTAAAAYHILIHQLKGLKDTPARADVAIKAAEAVAKITGANLKHDFLRAYMAKAFNPPDSAPELGTSTEVTQLPILQELSSPD
jgi:hypothetical protein